MSNSNFFLFSGPAGTGKSTFIKEFSRYLKFKNINFKITSTTGISVVDFKDGVTINSFSGMGIYKDIGSLKKIVNSSKFILKTREELMKIDVLIIDEISMLCYYQFELLNEIFKVARNNNQYFGGVKVLMFGDFLQLPPVISSAERNKYNFSSKYIPWIFESNLWEKLDVVYLELNTHFRQTDKEFIKNLDLLRFGKVVNKGYFDSLVSENIDSTIKLRSTRNEVSEINSIAIKENNNKEYIFKNKIFCKDFAKYNNEISELQKRFEKELILKVGLNVIHLINDSKKGIANGTTGKITKIVSDKIFVKWNNGKSNFLERYIEEKYDGENLDFRFSQFPINVSHSITIHKSQGMSLDYYDIDAKNIFAEGQAYVALSRGRDPKKINLKNFSLNSIKVNKKAIGFYYSKESSFIKLSKGDSSIFQVSKDSERLKERFYKEYINEVWRDKKWVKDNLIDKKIINKYQYDYFLKEPGIYKISILNKDNTKSFYVGQSINLIQRISYHVSNAFDENLDLRKKQNVTMKIREAGIENIKFEFLTNKEWFLGKYITKEDWSELNQWEKTKMIKKFLRYEENKEIIKLKNEINSKLIENRTHGINGN